MTVYFVQAQNGHVKIGTSMASRVRVSDLAREHGPLTLLASMPGDRRDEQATHERLAGSRVGDSEWFEPTAAVMSEIQAVVASHGPPVLGGIGITVRLEPALLDQLDALVCQLQAEPAARGMRMTRTIALRHLVVSGLDRELGKETRR